MILNIFLALAALTIVFLAYAYGVKHGTMYGIDLCKAELAKYFIAQEKKGTENDNA